MKAPFPWFGGKAKAADTIWARFGAVRNYVEPFAGSLAVLLDAPRIHAAETINDLDAFISNFWRATAIDPDAVAAAADWPVSEPDLHARHVRLMEMRQEFSTRVMGDPAYFDAEIAGWWVWGLCSWIGSGWCSGQGPWRSVDGVLVNDAPKGGGTLRQLPHLGDLGRGINRQLPHLGGGRGINRQLPHLGGGQGINRQLPHLGHGQGDAIRAMFREIRDRLRGVRVCCGDWRRVTGPSVTTKLGLTAVLLDPPYGDDADRTSNLYAVDSLSVAGEVREWALEHGDDPLMRIAFCGYVGEHEMPETWEAVAWAENGRAGGYSGQRKDGSDTKGNIRKERIWFSPHCERPGDDLFSWAKESADD